MASLVHLGQAALAGALILSAVTVGMTVWMGIKSARRRFVFKNEAGLVARGRIIAEYSVRDYIDWREAPVILAKTSAVGAGVAVLGFLCLVGLLEVIG